MKTYPQTHKCRDGVLYHWEARKEKPVACPRCQARLDAPKKKG